MKKIKIVYIKYIIFEFEFEFEFLKNAKDMLLHSHSITKFLNKLYCIVSFLQCSRKNMEMMISNIYITTPMNEY